VPIFGKECFVAGQPHEGLVQRLPAQRELLLINLSLSRFQKAFHFLDHIKAKVHLLLSEPVLEKLEN